MEIHQHNVELLGDPRKLNNKVPLRGRRSRRVVMVIDKEHKLHNALGFLMGEAFGQGAIIFPVTKRRGIVYILNKKEYIGVKWNER